MATSCPAAASKALATAPGTMFYIRPYQTFSHLLMVLPTKMLPNPILDSFTQLQKRVQDFSSNPDAIEADPDDHRDVEHPDFEEAVDRGNRCINEVVELAYGKLEFDFLPSFADSDEFPLLLGPRKDENTICEDLSIKVMEFLPSIISAHRMGGIFDPMESWIARGTMKLATPVALTNNGTCLSISSMGGYKERTPILTYYLLDDPAPAGKEFPLAARTADVGLTGIAWASTTDENKKLIFVADTSRVKSYAWADEESGEVYDTALPTHTLKTDRHAGPLHVLGAGRLLRAGKGSVAVWDLNGLTTHGPDGTVHIGRKFDTSDTWRDEDEVLEPSAGSKPTTIITLADLAVVPAQWHAHSSAVSTMLCGSDPDKSSDYSAVSVDLEHGGKTVARYLGHGGETRAFSTSAADPNFFMTAASDGHARLHDHRVPLPALSLRTGLRGDDCAGVVLVHPDGVPSVFTGVAGHQGIHLWDVRARKMVYELSTGNNAVTGMTWDAPRSALFVSTRCDYLDRNGEVFDYRRAKLPRILWRLESVGSGEDDSMTGGSDSDEDYNDDASCWPKNAAYAEDYFGHLFDAGNNRLFRYAFKEQADPSILPEYGDASLDTEPSW
ncbi:hypothetical protein DFH09DRAFT_1249770 [Mycena vulgaris]|nr:hypothetical protein DFH09DRAFT_1249770 [Mycena vulgaris]